MTGGTEPDEQAIQKFLARQRAAEAKAAHDARKAQEQQAGQE